MKFGLIGSAHMHIGMFVNDMLKAGNEFIGIWNDGSPVSLSLSSQFNVPLYEKQEDLFQKGIEIAGTSAVNNQKIDIIEACERNGVHIMADKPIVAGEDQLKRLEAVIERGKIQVGLMLTLRFIPAVCTVKKLIESGIIGKLLSVEIFNPHKLSPEIRPDWHFDPEKSGGIAVDLFIHSIDCFSWLTGNKITEYSGVMMKSILADKPGFYDASQFMVLGTDGVSGYFRVDWHVPENHWTWGDLRIFCTGSKGLIEAKVVGDPVTKEAQVILYGTEKGTAYVDMESIKETETTDFIERIQGREYSISHRDILDATRLSIEFCNKAKRIIM